MMKAILDAGNYLNSNNDVESVKNAVNGGSENTDFKVIEMGKEKVKVKEMERISIIFCHADIQGASMNDGMRCREGLDISAFPPNLPIYSGHFHKPHTVSTTHRTCMSSECGTCQTQLYHFSYIFHMIFILPFSATLTFQYLLFLYFIFFIPILFFFSFLIFCIYYTCR